MTKTSNEEDFYKFRHIAGEDLWNRKTFNKYFKKWQNTGLLEWRDRLTLANEPLVQDIAIAFYNGLETGCLGVSDLANYGREGLYRAFDRYNPDNTKNASFATYARWWIRQKISRAIQDESRMIRLPIPLNRTLTSITKHADYLTGINGREPTYEEIADSIGMSAEKLERIMAYTMSPLSLDDEVFEGEDGETSIALIESPYETPDEQTIRTDTDEKVRNLLKYIPDEKTRKVLEMRVGMNGFPAMTLRQVGEEFGITRERIRQIQEKAIRIIKRKGLKKLIELGCEHYGLRPDEVVEIRNKSRK